MNTPFLPGPIWALVTGLSLMLVLVACAIYLWYRSRIKAAIEDYEDVSNLAAKNDLLKAEIQQSQQ